MANCSIALQILPMYTEQETTIRAVDQVIAYLKERTDQIEISAFETTIMGEFDGMMALLKGAIEVAGKEHAQIFTNVKINYHAGGQVLSIDEKVTKHR